MRKRKLSDLVREEIQQPEAESEATDSQNLEETELQSPKEPELQTTKQPKYLTLIRKEARFREDQIDALTALTRKLNRKRKGGERLTENTLIRVAVDLLLSQSDELSGTTENELMRSLNLEVTE